MIIIHSTEPISMGIANGRCGAQPGYFSHRRRMTLGGRPLNRKPNVELANCQVLCYDSKNVIMEMVNACIFPATTGQPTFALARSRGSASSRYSQLQLLGDIFLLICCRCATEKKRDNSRLQPRPASRGEIESVTVDGQRVRQAGRGRRRAERFRCHAAVGRSVNG